MSGYSIDSKTEIVIFGAGKRGRALTGFIERYGGIILRAVFDNDPFKQGAKLSKWIIKNPSSLGNYTNCLLCISVANHDARQELETLIKKKYSFPKERIINYEDLLRFLIKAKIIKFGFKNHYEDISKTPSVIFESTKGFGLGGIERWTKDICETLTARTHYNVRVIAGRQYDSVDDQMYEIIDRITAEDSYMLVVELANYLCQKSPCIFISSQPAEALMAATIVKELYPKKIQIVSVIHGGRGDIYSKYISYTIWISRMLAVSTRIKKDFMNLGVDEEIIDVITCSYNADYSIERSYTKDEKNPIRIGYAGRIVYPQKRMDLIMKFLDKLNNSGINYYFEIAGEGEASEDILAFIRSKDLDDKVKLLGEVPSSRIPYFWSRQDIAVNLSDYEGHSISQMEAMAAGAIPIVTDTSGAEDDIKDGVNGFIVPIGDYLMAVKKIMYLNNNRDRLSEMGIEARNTLLEKGRENNQELYWTCLLNKLINRLG